jgi:hypothetical protein
MAVHWDGKLVTTLDDKYQKEERCAVLVSGNFFKIIRCVAFVNNYTKVLIMICCYDKP